MSNTLHIKAESRVAIVTFAICSLWSIAQGEWMLRAHRIADEKSEDDQAADPSHLGCGGNPARLSERLLAADAQRPWPRLPLALAPLSLGMTIAGLALPAL